MSTTDQIRSLLDDCAAAARRNDLDAVAAHHHPDIRPFDVPPPTQHQGLDAYRRSWQDFFAWMQPDGFAVDDLAIVAGTDVAFAYGLIRCAGTDPDGTTQQLTIGLAVGLQRCGDDRHVLHEHHSEPAGS